MKAKRIKVQAETMILRLRASEAGRKAAAIEHHMEAGSEMQPHVHSREDELFHVLEGRVTYKVGRKTIRAKAGDTVWGPRNIPHSYKVGRKPARVLVTLLPGGGEKIFIDLARLREAAEDADLKKVYARHGVKLL